MEKKTITGFSKLSKRGKIKWIVENFFKDPENVMRELKSYLLDNEEHQKILDGISENSISNYVLPYSVAPNVRVNGKTYVVPMVTEESSVVAAASSAAKFWMSRGGFQTRIHDTEKVGHIHFIWSGQFEKLHDRLDSLRNKIFTDIHPLCANMSARGGGVKRIELKDFSDQMTNYYQLMFFFETKDSMGANFINSILEQAAQSMDQFFLEQEDFDENEREVDVQMSILSNYTPECIVETWAECPIEDLGEFSGGINAYEFAQRFCRAVQFAKIDPYRATTHNKGIFNGIDAVVIATANDFRAIEAGGHAYAARDGQYRGLSDCKIENGQFRFSLTIPISIGTVGGLTSLHPVAKRSFELMGHPDARELMGIIAAIGLAQNFAALRSLITTGIQKGHMRMHLGNILIQLQANPEEKEAAIDHFEDLTVSFQNVRVFIESLRKNKQKVIST
jgi:hydroxymethylglutaryl-CoA reductase